MEICKQHLVLPGSSRDMAAKLIGRLLTRPDTGGALLEFLEWCHATELLSSDAAIFLVPGKFTLLSVRYALYLHQNTKRLVRKALFFIVACKEDHHTVNLMTAKSFWCRSIAVPV